jgi:hypothetical protein
MINKGDEISSTLATNGEMQEPTMEEPEEVNMIDDWIDPQDKLPLLLTLSLYQEPIQALGGYTLQKSTSRAGIWTHENGTTIVGLRGTNPSGTDFKMDLLDDWKIATSRQKCNLSLVDNIEIPESPNLIFVGHSLGGAAAMCLGEKYPQSRVIAFNAGAPPTNPVLTGPGARAVHYHVMGDIISSHMGSNAARIVRIEKIGKQKWLSSYPHSSQRLMRGDGAWKFVSMEDEQASWQRFGTQASAFTRQIVSQNPIPV